MSNIESRQSPRPEVTEEQKDGEIRFDDHSDPSISEKGSSSSLTKWQRLKARFPYWRLAVDILVGCFFTAWWLSIIIQDKHRHKWLIPTVLWGMLMVRLISWHCRILYIIYHHAAKVWNWATDIVYTRVLTTRPRRLLVGATITVGVVLLGTFVPEEIEFSKRKDRAISFCGVVVAIIGLYATSKNRSKIQWNAVIGGMLMQYIIALFVLRTKAGYDIFNFISFLARKLLGFAKDGVAFLTNAEVSQLGMFFFTVLPAVAFFVAFVHIFYYYGVIQWFIGKFAKFFFWTLRISGAEAITASASPFIGIGESAILIKDLLPFLTQAELHQVMTSGFSTISGAVLVGYIGLGLNAQALVSSCIMSIPGSIAVSKLRFPETEVPLSQGRVEFPEETDPNKKPRNVLQSFSEGATLGLYTAATMLVQCMCIIALVALINGILTWFGGFWNIKELTLDLIFGYIFYPATFFLGVPRDEILNISKLISVKFMQNEYVAYNMLVNEAPYNQLSDRGNLIATYALCGFANFGSMGITLGVLNTLSKGKRSSDISKEIWSALFSGLVSTMISAAVAGMVIHDLSGFDKN
ncbi:hypothetical protein ACI3LY_002265 [Candidozyma auris]|uniref:Uncharacterized protein n=2 Tax=Candidozyma auris TaxID=498019 RepID=A0A2H0ZL64_CANAR|nr:hypothetical_protein [[Candida] auris]KND98087.1 hypothetical protein QG37_05066 [[Candida] auris]PIS51375.1 hypothetical protein B9J08_002954 [[Candida] auris]PIS53361.1 hypothetical protein CJI97_003027 [[Candida] auris]QEO20000.1 hypothetical_protein [[Candida] auris]QWW22235.1 hypothetical protein CA7LBN_000981 [[Candida] auris]